MCKMAIQSLKQSKFDPIEELQFKPTILAGSGVMALDGHTTPSLLHNCIFPATTVSGLLLSVSCKIFLMRSMTKKLAFSKTVCSDEFHISRFIQHIISGLIISELESCGVAILAAGTGHKPPRQNGQLSRNGLIHFTLICMGKIVPEY